MGVRTTEEPRPVALTVESITFSIRRNPVTVAGMLTGVVTALGGVTAARGVMGRCPCGEDRPSRGRTLIALLTAVGASVVIGRITQRWTWSDDRVTDELLDAELLLWDGQELLDPVEV